MKKNLQKFTLISFFCLLFLIVIISKQEVNKNTFQSVSTSYEALYKKIFGRKFLERQKITIALENLEHYYQKSPQPKRFDNQAMKVWLGLSNVDALIQNSLDEPLLRMLDKDVLNQAARNHQIYTYKDSGEVQIEVQQLDDIMIRSLYCDYNGFNQKDYYLVLQTRDYQGGYGDTHFLIYNLLLQALDCFDLEILKHHEREVVTTIIQAQEYEMIKESVLFSDLFAERMVVLAWAGRKNHFNPLWIDILLEQQSSNGSWTEQEFPPYFSQERIQERIFHASGLAGLALQYYYEDKTLAHWFVKQ